MSEPDDPRWLEEIGGELRREVPVRPTWRAQLLEDVARSPRPSPDVDDRFDGDAALGTRRRQVVLSPAVAIAAALAFTVLGAGVMFSVLPARPGDAASTLSTALRATSPVRPVSTADLENVQFELSAPRASRVALVGSFNEWNPRATPLARDAATGKWIVSVRLTPGRHVYAFVVDGDVTADPSAPRAADDDFGSRNSVVFVSAPRT
jgi:hypothetical protein